MRNSAGQKRVHPAITGVVDGDTIRTLALPVGTKVYITVLGANIILMGCNMRCPFGRP